MALGRLSRSTMWDPCTLEKCDRKLGVQHQPAILTHWEAEAGGFQVPAQPGQLSVEACSGEPSHAQRRVCELISSAVPPDMHVCHAAGPTAPGPGQACVRNQA